MTCVRERRLTKLGPLSGWTSFETTRKRTVVQLICSTDALYGTTRTLTAKGECMTSPLSELLWTDSQDGGDPYIRLEALEDEAVDSWVRAQTARTTAEFGCTARAEVLTRRFASAMLSQDQIVMCSRWGDWAYNTWRDEDRPLGFVRRTRWDAWIDGNPQWEVVLEIDALEPNDRGDSSTRWTLADFQLIYPVADRALVFLSPGGSDVCVVREFDMEARAFVENGFELNEPGHHSVAWIDRDSVYASWDDSATSAAPAVTDSGYPRQVRRWHRGTAITDAPIVFECETGDLSVSASFDPVLARHSIVCDTGFYETEQFWLEAATGQWRMYDVPRDANLFEWGQWMLLMPRFDWNIDGALHQGGSLLTIRREALLAGDRRFTTLFTPAGRAALTSVECTKSWLVVLHKRDGITFATLWRAPNSSDETWVQREYPLPDGCETSLSSVDSARDDEVLIYVEHFLRPPELYYADLSCNAPWRKLGALPPQFDSTGFVASRRHAVAPDGVPIPYWVIGRETDPSGPARPCLLYGYGGFEVSLDTPAYVDTLGFSWLEPGGVYVIACVRGGGEFGAEWHQAAQEKKRQVAFDDFIAVAAALIESGVTTPEQLAIQGGSNGGLLTAVCMTQRPELFGAVVSEVPVLDMLRFHLLSQGALWIDEYGDSGDPDVRRVLKSYSPYHNVESHVPYPPVLFTSSSTDDRVHPGHARKMVAKMQALGHPNVWYLEQRDGGHAATGEPEALARTSAITFEFLRATIGSALT